MPDAPTVHQALVSVLRRLPPIKKDQRNEAQRFMFRGIENILEAARPLLAAEGVLIIPDVEERIGESRTTSKGNALNVVHLHVRYRIIGPNGDTIETSTWGEGSDSGDKATPKAMTCAYKYMLTEVLQVAENELDPDRTGVEATPQSSRRSKNSEGPKPSTSPPPSTAAAKAAPPTAPPPTRRKAETASREPAPSPPRRANADGEELLTEAQMKKLIVLQKERGWTDEQLREAAGVSSRKDITKDRASKLIDELEVPWDKGMAREAPDAPPPVEAHSAEWEQAFEELQSLFRGAFENRPVAHSRYRDRLLADHNVESLEDLTLEQLQAAADPLRAKATA